MENKINIDDSIIMQRHEEAFDSLSQVVVNQYFMGQASILALILQAGKKDTTMEEMVLIALDLAKSDEDISIFIAEFMQDLEEEDGGGF